MNINGVAVEAYPDIVQGLRRAQMGIHRPRLHPAQHAEGGERARRHQKERRGARARDRQTPARLARARPDRNLGDARHAGRGRLRLRRRLGARRPAGVAEDARQADPQHSLHAGMQRRRHDADPAPQGERVLRAGDGPVRADLQGRQRLGAGDGDFGASLHHGRAAPRQIFPQDFREDPQEEGRAVLDRRADRRLVRQGRPEGVRDHASARTPRLFRRSKTARRCNFPRACAW